MCQLRIQVVVNQMSFPSLSLSPLSFPKCVGVQRLNVINAAPSAFVIHRLANLLDTPRWLSGNYSEGSHNLCATTTCNKWSSSISWPIEQLITVADEWWWKSWPPATIWIWLYLYVSRWDRIIIRINRAFTIPRSIDQFTINFLNLQMNKWMMSKITSYPLRVSLVTGLFYTVAVVVLVSDFKFPDYLHNKIAHRGIE